MAAMGMQKIVIVDKIEGDSWGKSVTNWDEFCLVGNWGITKRN